MHDAAPNTKQSRSIANHVTNHSPRTSSGRNRHLVRLETSRSLVNAFGSVSDLEETGATCEANLVQNRPTVKTLLRLDAGGDAHGPVAGAELELVGRLQVGRVLGQLLTASLLGAAIHAKEMPNPTIEAGS